MFLSSLEENRFDELIIRQQTAEISSLSETRFEGEELELDLSLS